jgi:HD-GYP domain-containing protein (c-di-GMP phosphodiesterase class II)
MAHAGIDFKEFFPDDKSFFSVDTEEGFDYISAAILTGKTCIYNNILSDPKFIPLREEAIKRNYSSIIAIPLMDNKKAIGVMAVYGEDTECFGIEDNNILTEIADHIVYGILGLKIRIKKEVAEAQLKASLEKVRNILSGTMHTVTSIVERRDPYTAGHQRRVADLARTIGKKMNLLNYRIEGLRISGAIHDLGKISVPAEILCKPGKLEVPEFEIIKEHTRIGSDLLKDMEFTWPVYKIILQHHERMDGSGYPEGLSGENILLEARILAVADVVEAMASHRPYRPSLGIDKALDEIVKSKGALYDPDAVNACVQVIEDDGYKFPVI